MNKYDIDLDLENKNSLSSIISRVKEHSKILEFGPSHGRLTRFLKEYMKCKVYCVEIDENAAKEASVFAEQMIVGDIESLEWTKTLNEKDFDYIIFADVLEHLRNPKKILTYVKDLLKDEGSILISIPNVAHSSILIDMLQDKFIYRAVGLLDETHIKLFTKTTLDTMIKECDLYKKYETSIQIQPENTEFSNSYSELPKEVASFIKRKPYSTAYQFIMELSKDKPSSTISDFENETDTASDTKTKFTDYKKNPSLSTKLKTIAFYLPQFHPFEENDKWWGKGFTEWSNVTKAKPNFKGHYQPHLPIHYGFYDLRIPEIMHEQAKLARNYGIHGFNFYYYWFGGKVLMHRPFDILLKYKDIDINFCITWANENWTRAWDASENEILIAQKHSKEDSKEFIRSLFKYFKDDRYIYVDNKPLLIIYRCDIIPNIKETTLIWREEAKKEGFEDLYLVCAQTYGIKNPKDYGFDAAMEFPPHNTLNSEYIIKKDITNSKFEGNIFDYNQVVDNQYSKEKDLDYKRFECVMLSWDNTARRQDNANIFANFSLEKYKEWVLNTAFNTYENEELKDNEKFIFINAWNEWAEGTHLEPDREYGYGYLQSTYDVLKNFEEKNLSYINPLLKPKKSKNALIFHIYEQDKWEDIENILNKYHKNNFDLYITLTSIDKEIINKIEEIYPNCNIQFIKKEDEDILSFIETYKKIIPLNYEKIWREHTKKIDNNESTKFSFDINVDNIISLLKSNSKDKKRISQFLDYSFTCEDLKTSKKQEGNESFNKKEEQPQINNILEEIHNHKQIYVPKSNNLTLANKISIMLQKIDELKKDNKRIVVYGNGYLGRMLASFLDKNLIAVLDKLPKQGFPYNIIKPEEINNYSYDFIIISVLGREVEILESLNNHGVDSKKIIIL